MAAVRGRRPPMSTPTSLQAVTVRAVTVDDLDWVVAALAERRKLLVPRVPIFWRPSEHAGL